jgi:pyruvate-ferredoxin/flavodoxin oxidoreductase
MKPESKKKSNPVPVERAGCLMSGAEAVLRTLTGLVDSVAVCSETMANGISIADSDTSDSIRTMDDPAGALAYADGMAATGVTAAAFLESNRLPGITDQIRSAATRHIPLTVVVSRSLSASSIFSASGAQNSFVPLVDAGCPILVASTVQELVDFITIARVLSDAALIPVVVIADGRDTVWSIQSVDIPDSGLSPGVAGLRSTYRSMLFGSNDTAERIWVDPGNPVAAGMKMSDSIALKMRVGRYAFLRRDLDDLMVRIFSDFSEETGRSYGSVSFSGPERSKIALIATGSVADRLQYLTENSRNKGASVRVIRISVLNPFPSAEIADQIRSARRIGVLVSSSESDLEDLFMVRMIRSALFSKQTTDKKKRRDSSALTTHVAPVLYSEDWIPNLPEVKTLASRLESSDLHTGPLVLGTNLSASGVRAPEIERIRQQLIAADIDLTPYELSAVDSDSSGGSGSVIILAETGRRTWHLLQNVSELLSQAGARRVHASFHPVSDATRRPVIGRISWQTGSETQVFVLATRPALFHSLDVRPCISGGSHIIVNRPVETDGNAVPTGYPAWMTSSGATITEIGRSSPDSQGGQDLDDNLTLVIAFTRLHPVFKGIRTGVLLKTRALSSVDESGFASLVKSLDEELQSDSAGHAMAATDRIPETRPPPEIVDLPAAELPIADLNRFWKTTGYLYRAGRSDDIPVDPFLTSGMIPARAGALTAHASDSEEVPRVIAERCTGCGACWSICPEAAYVTNLFTVESLFDSAMKSARSAGHSFVHVPRLKPAIVKTMHRLAAQDDLNQFPMIGDLMIEAFERVLEKAGLDEEKQRQILAERDSLIAPVALLQTVRTQTFFGAAEIEKKGSGRLLSLSVDPDACTACGLCISSCTEDALEAIRWPVEGINLPGEWAAASELIVPALELDPEILSQEKVMTPLLLAGPTTSRVYRAGGADVGNLNRTALKLFLEGQNAYSAPVLSSLCARIRDMIKRIDARVQDHVNEAVEINDFQAFTRSLQDLEGKISPELLTRLVVGTTEPESGDKTDTVREDPLSHLARIREDLSIRLDGLTTSDEAYQLPHMVLTIAMTERSFGLTGYPINPFAMPTIHVEADRAADFVAGLEEGLRRKYSQILSALRTAELVLDDVYDPAPGVDLEPELSGAMRPAVLLVTDRFDDDLARLLADGRNINVLLVSGGTTATGVGERRPDPMRLALSIDNVYLRQTTTADPVKLLAAFIRGMAYDGPTLFNVYAPDSVRDGVSLTDAVATAELAVRSGVFPEIRRIPGSGPEILSGSDTSGFEEEDPVRWMQAQERFAGLFRFVPRRDWSGNQVRIKEWFALPEDARNDSVPFIERTKSGGHIARYVLEKPLVSFVSNSLSSLQEWISLAAAGETVDSSETVARDESTSSESPVQDSPVSSVDVDSLQTLSESLLRMSGFGGSDTPLGSLISSPTEEKPS